MRRPVSFALTTLILAGGLLSAAGRWAVADDVLDWNSTLRDAMLTRTNSYYANPGYATRSMAMANAAMFDIMMSYDKTHKPYLYNGPALGGADQSAALAQAAYAIMADLYTQPLTGPNASPADAQQAAAIAGNLQTALNAKLNAVSDVNARSAGVTFGNQIAAQYLAARAGDKINVPVLYSPDPLETPGHWQPDPFWPATHGGQQQQAWGPNWGNVTPFVLPNSNPFAMPAPPALNSLEYKLAYDQVKDYGALNSGVRNQDQTDIGLFWAYDRPGMGPPSIKFSKDLEVIGQLLGNSQAENARLFTLVSLGMADAGIASWESKFTHDFWRPVTAIQQGDTDGNILTEGDAGWRPLGAPGANPASTADDFTPPFPAYTSGHATFGGAMFEVLRQFYGTDLLNYTLSSHEMPPGSHLVNMSSLSPGDVLALRGVYGDAYVDAALLTPGQMISLDNDLRMFNSFSEAEFENGISRVYLGVHWSFDATEGIRLGNQIGDYAFDNFLTPVPEPSSYALLGTALAGVVIFQVRRRRMIAA